MAGAGGLLFVLSAFLDLDLWVRGRKNAASTRRPAMTSQTPASNPQSFHPNTTHANTSHSDTPTPGTYAFPHERLDAWRVARQFYLQCSQLQGLPRASGHAGDQLERAALSVVLKLILHRPGVPGGIHRRPGPGHRQGPAGPGHHHPHPNHRPPGRRHADGADEGGRRAVNRESCVVNRPAGHPNTTHEHGARYTAGSACFARGWDGEMVGDGTRALIRPFGPPSPTGEGDLEGDIW